MDTDLNKTILEQLFYHTDDLNAEQSGIKAPLDSVLLTNFPTLTFLPSISKTNVCFIPTVVGNLNNVYP